MAIMIHFDENPEKASEVSYKVFLFLCKSFFYHWVPWELCFDRAVLLLTEGKHYIECDIETKTKINAELKELDNKGR